MPKINLIHFRLNFHLLTSPYHKCRAQCCSYLTNSDKSDGPPGNPLGTSGGCDPDAPSPLRAQGRPSGPNRRGILKKIIKSKYERKKN